MSGSTPRGAREEQSCVPSFSLIPAGQLANTPTLNIHLKNLTCSKHQSVLKLEDQKGLEFDWTILILLPFTEALMTPDPVAVGTLCAQCDHSFMKEKVHSNTNPFRLQQGEPLRVSCRVEGEPDDPSQSHHRTFQGATRVTDSRNPNSYPLPFL